jgi:hypothetical protein
MKIFFRTSYVCGVYPRLVSRWPGILMKISRHTSISYLDRMIYQYSTRMGGNWLDYTWTSVFFCSQIMIKLNIKFGRRSISLRGLRSHFDRYAVGFVLELAGFIMFPDNSGDSVPAFLLPILMVRVIK